jgi:peptidoglycan/xylan/chitin deacetylase (PgdA/CDA1 family)
VTDSELAAHVADTTSVHGFTDTAATLATINTRDRLGAFPQGRGAVVFTLDDGYSSWSTMAAYAEARNQRITFCVQTNRIDGANAPTSAQIESFFDAGHEIASHSVTHVSISGESVANRVAEYDNSKSTLEAIVGAGNVTTWAYPFGSTSARSQTTDAELYGRYDRLLSTAQGMCRFPLQQPTPFVAGRLPVNAAAMPGVLAQIRQVARTGELLVLYGHGWDSGIGGEASQAEYESIFDLCDTLGVPMVTAAEAMPHPCRLVNASFESATTAVGWSESLADATVTVETVTPDTGIAGTKALQIATSGTGNNIVFQQVAVPSSSGVEHTISCRGRLTAGTIAGGTVGIRVHEVDPFGTRSSVISTSVTTFTGSWAVISRAFNVPAYIKYVSVELFISGQAGLTAQFDHVWFGPSSLGSMG